MWASTLESSGFSPMVMVPSKVLKEPLTLLTIRCRTLKPTSEWTGSMVQVPATRPGTSTVGVLMERPPWDGHSIDWSTRLTCQRQV